MDDRDSTSTPSLTSWDITSTPTSTSGSSSSSHQHSHPLGWLQNFRGKDLVQVAADLAWAFLEVVSMEGIGRTESKDEFRRILEKFGISSQGSSLTIPTYPDAILWSFLQQAIERFADMIHERWERSLVLPRYIRGRLLDLFMLPNHRQTWIEYARRQPDGRILCFFPEN